MERTAAGEEDLRARSETDNTIPLRARSIGDGTSSIAARTLNRTAVGRPRSVLYARCSRCAPRRHHRRHLAPSLQSARIPLAQTRSSGRHARPAIQVRICTLSRVRSEPSAVCVTIPQKTSLRQTTDSTESGNPSVTVSNAFAVPSVGDTRRLTRTTLC
jgi:hypothetical protein